MWGSSLARTHNARMRFLFLLYQSIALLILVCLWRVGFNLFTERLNFPFLEILSHDCQANSLIALPANRHAHRQRSAGYMHAVAMCVGIDRPRRALHNNL